MGCELCDSSSLRGVYRDEVAIVCRCAAIACQQKLCRAANLLIGSYWPNCTSVLFQGNKIRKLYDPHSMPYQKKLITHIMKL